MTITQNPIARERLLKQLAASLEEVLAESPEGVTADQLLIEVSTRHQQPLEFVTMALTRIDYVESNDDGLLHARNAG